MQSCVAQLTLDIPVDVGAITQVAKGVLAEAFSPPEQMAENYTMLGLVVTHYMREKGTPVVHISPSSLSKGFKNHGLGNVVRRIMQPDSQQFSWMATVMLEVFGLGVLVTTYDTLMFIDLGSMQLRERHRINVTDIEDAFTAVTKVGSTITH